MAWRTSARGARDTRALVCMPALQVAESSLYFVARTSGDAMSLPANVRVGARGRSLLPFRLAYLDELNGRMMARSSSARCSDVFAIVALGIAAVGLYGVMAYLVAQHARIGIRLALGGRPARADRRDDETRHDAVRARARTRRRVRLSRVLQDLTFSIRRPTATPILPSPRSCWCRGGRLLHARARSVRVDPSHAARMS